MTGAVTADALLTPRLRLRPFVVGDHPARTAMGAMPDSYRFTGGVAATPEDNWHRVLRYIGHWAAFGYGMFAVTERATGRFVGEAGAMDFRRGIAGFGGVPETAWMFVTDVHGTGMAGEAMRAVLAWLDDGAADGVGRAGTACIVAPDNAASMRLAARIGYAATGTARYRNDAVTVLTRPAAGATLPLKPC